MIRTLYNKKSGRSYQTDPHQQTAYEHLYANPRAALFLGMSLSKTVIALSYLYDMHYREAAITKTLVVAPDKSGAHHMARRARDVGTFGRYALQCNSRHCRTACEGA